MLRALNVFRSFHMAIDADRKTEQEPASSNVRHFVPRAAALTSSKKTVRLPAVAGTHPLPKGCSGRDDGDDPGPSAA
jgi:hypothetical protein